MKKAEQILREFVKDDELGGTSPLPRHRLVEVCILLEQLRALELEEDEDLFKDIGVEPPPSVPPPPTPTQKTLRLHQHSNKKKGGSKSPRKELLRTNKRKHLLVLFPLLCDCITTKEGRTRGVLKEIFHLAGRELGLS